MPWAVRSHRNGALGLGAGLGLLVAVTGPSYVAAANAIAGGLSTLAQQALPIAREFQFLTGPPDRLDTVGGYLSYKVFGTVVLIVALYAAVQGAQVIRGSESKGLFDLWLSAGRSRGQLLADRAYSFLMMLAATTGILYLGTGASGVLSGESLWIPALGQCAVVFLVGGLAFALSLLTSQVMRSTRAAAAIAAAYLIAGYFVANVADSLGAVGFLRFLSPFWYYLQERTLVPGHPLDGSAILVLLVVGAALGCAAWRLLLIRDSGGVAIGARVRARPVDHTFRPSLLVRRWLWLSWAWEQRVSLASWCLGIFTLITVETAVVPAALKLIRGDHGALAGLTANLTQEQYVGFLLTFVMAVVAGFVVYEVAHWVGDASHQRVDAVLAQPVGTRSFVAHRLASLIAISTLLALALVAGAATGAAIGGYRLDAAGLARTFADAVLFGVAVGAVGMLAVALLGRGAATAVTGGLLLTCFFLTTISSLLRWPSWINHVSVFDAFGTPYQAWPPVGGAAYLGALVVVCTVGTWLAMRRAGGSAPLVSRRRARPAGSRDHGRRSAPRRADHSRPFR